MSNARHHKVRNDLIFILGLMLLVAALGLAFFLFRDVGDTVEVTVNGVRYGTYPLSQDRVEDIHTGETELNRLVIRGGEAFVETATCPDGICAGHRPISREGESIVCLPHRVVVTIIRTGTDTGPDIVV